MSRVRGLSSWSLALVLVVAACGGGVDEVGGTGATCGGKCSEPGGGLTGALLGAWNNGPTHVAVFCNSGIWRAYDVGSCTGHWWSVNDDTVTVAVDCWGPTSHPDGGGEAKYPLYRGVGACTELTDTSGC
jgi:hypothetical protein